MLHFSLHVHLLRARGEVCRAAHTTIHANTVQGTQLTEVAESEAPNRQISPHAHEMAQHHKHVKMESVDGWRE